MPEGVRLQKALAQLGFGSRRQVESWIRAGRLTVNGEVAALGTRVRESDQIRLDGRLVRRRPPAAQQGFVCHRSPGEPLDQYAERLPHVGGRRFISVSPMPLQDGGLELVTSDGELAAKLQRAARELTAEFSVRIHGELDDARLASVLEGRLDAGAPLEVQSCVPSGGEGSNRWYALVVRGASGKEVRQMFERSGALVSRVLRTRLGPVALDRTLARGQYRKLDPQALQELLASTGEVAAEPTRSPRPARPMQRSARRQTTAHRSSGRSRPGSPGRAGRGRGR